MYKYFFAIIMASLGTFAISAPLTNCTKDEKVVFSCSAGKKIISLCAAPLKSHDDYLEYRFANGKTKFSYRADKFNPEHYFERSIVVGASSMSTLIWFKNGDYTYVLNDPIKGDPFLTVRRSNKEIARIQCLADFSGDSELPNKNIWQRNSEEYFELLR
jgi:hypothetical protein